MFGMICRPDTDQLASFVKKRDPHYQGILGAHILLHPSFRKSKE